MDGLPGKSLLILEDEVLIAMDHQFNAERAGFKSVTILSSCATAHVWLSSNSPSVALLDVQLQDGSCSEVATFEEQRAFRSSFARVQARDDADPAFRSGIWLPKPCTPEDLLIALTQAREKASRQAQEV
jgi:DNA-binding response OmpR family regulator